MTNMNADWNRRQVEQALTGVTDVTPVDELAERIEQLEDFVFLPKYGPVEAQEQLAATVLAFRGSGAWKRPARDAFAEVGFSMADYGPPDE